MAMRTLFAAMENADYFPIAPMNRDGGLDPFVYAWIVGKVLEDGITV